MFTLAVLLNFVIIAKVIYGEHRPHFFDRCQPDTANCTLGTLVSNFICTNHNLTKLQLRDVSGSFPSGHAALAVYFSAFMIWFLQQRLPKMNVKYFVPLLQTSFIIYAMICSLTRISDNAHHPNDVLFGSIFGLGFFLFNVKFY